MALNTINHTGTRLVTGLTATGSTQATAFRLVGGTAFHEFTTVGSGTGAILPLTKLPITITISNAGAQTLAVYPPVGGKVNGGVVNSPALVVARSSITYWAAGPLTWYSTGAAGGAGIAAVTSGTVTSVSVVTANGVSGSVATETVTPAITLTLGDITPSSVAATGTVTGSNLSGENTGDAGTVTSVSVVTANGVSGSVATETVTPAITLTLGDITPTSIGSATTATTQAASDNSTKIATTAFVAAATTISASNITTGTLAAAQLPTVGLTIGQHVSPMTTDTDGATVTFDLAVTDWHQVTLTDNRILALANPATGQVFYLKLIQDGVGSHTVTWFTTIKWAGGSAPTLTATGDKADVVCFRCTGSGTYDGFVVGQNI